ncbi:unnamed protein product [Phyllotreta striolata]|uniref:Phosphatidic acid phosphatase type 2/haloperoxidase domain-containing protein n=1 Tax=Phyllotreta striolata TaxID=444603 RepID=A0A9N9TSK9_PHYSR|nr:unnamed protein product [Phyllotreta striolata]
MSLEMKEIDAEIDENENVKEDQTLIDNKAMVNVTTAPSERTSSPTVRVNVVNTQQSTVSDKSPSTERSRFRLRRRFTLPVVLNSFLIIIVLSLLVLLEFGYIPGNQQGYYCEDPQLSFKYNGEIVSPLMLGVGCLTLPFIMLLLADVLSRRSYKNIDFGLIWFYYKECTIGCVLVLLLTEVAKIIIGEHRPHFLDVCQPDNALACRAGEFMSTFRCTNPKYSRYFLTDSSRSFPSGHASVSWFTGIFSAYVIQTRLSTTHTGRLLKPFMISICFTWSLLCSLTRITDRRHHWWDVLAGAMLGTAGAFYTIRLVHNFVYSNSDISKVSSSTTTLLDVKNKDATSVII